MLRFPIIKKPIFWAAFLGLATLAAFLPAIRHEFLIYDDQEYVTENRHVQAGITGQNFVWAFGRHAGNWHPLTWISHMADCSLFRLKPAGHHFTSILLHSLTAALLFLLVGQMTRAWRRAFIVAALFAWHPAHVESVAWIAERKDVLCGFFWMLTLHAYWRYAKANEEWSGRVWYGAALVGLALALMSKPMAVSLPVVMLLLDYWPLDRISDGAGRLWKILGEKLPFAAMSAGACALTLWAQKAAIVSTKGLSVMERATHAAVAYEHYLLTFLLPRRLAIFYAYEVSLPWERVFVAIVILLFLTTVALKLRRKAGYFIVGWFWFLITLVPVIGLVQVGEQAWADRYTYLPFVGLSIAGCWGGHDLLVWARNRFPESSLLRFNQSLAALLAGLLGFLLWQTEVQLSYWKNTWSVFEHTAKVTPRNYMAETLLGSILAQRGNLDEAMRYYDQALAWQPAYPEARFFRANALDQKGKLDQAIAEYRLALYSKPRQEPTHIYLGIALVKKQKYEEAAAHDLEALRINPESAVAHQNLAKIRQIQGRTDEALREYALALKWDPSLAQAHNNLGVLYLQRGESQKGKLELEQALKLNPGNAETEYNLGRALSQVGEWEKAVELFGKQKSSGNPEVHFSYGVALLHLGKIRDAAAELAAALLIKPDHADALERLAWILSTNSKIDFRNGEEAVKMAQRAVELTGDMDGGKLKTLAAAFAETGRWDEANATIEKAISRFESKASPELEKCRLMHDAFKSRKPWRE